MKYFNTIILIFCLLTVSEKLHAQTSINSDSLLLEAKNCVKKNDYSSAYSLLNKILSKNEDNDIRLYLGLAYSWDGKYDDARREIEKVLTSRPQSQEVILALVNIEMWSDNPQKALDILNKALATSPENIDYLYRKAQVLDKLKRPNDAIQVLDSILAKDPNNEKAKNLRTAIKIENAKNRISVNFTKESIDGLSPWYSGNVQYSRKTNLGSIIGRVNYAQRYGLKGYQYEMDAYPKTGKSNYLYVNAGYSKAPTFPKYRSGLEFYQSLPKSFDASIGFRYLVFDQSKVTIFTGSIGKYLGNYWLCFRPFVTPSSGQVPSITGFFIVRRYFSNPETYIGLQYGYGSSPDDVSRFISKTQRLQSNKVKLTLNKCFKTFWVASLSTSYEYEEYSAKSYRNRYLFDITLQRIF